MVFEPEKAISTPAVSSPDHGNIAYKLLLLQQRLVAYEQLHNEEMAELRKELEQLRRQFLLETSSHTPETNPHIRAVSPLRKNLKAES
ncbi:hypothetical protein EPA93_33555 [Ktedonosporobacter rubrisoli]|uniref:Uncharacterized protein n=1 Tax=Ktedonosporobacter rubrisoli TaxID=2509675 RepID=A0A4P6JXY2_KTERU|nr:hypothetical protein [Ktedonosporobacter rubrisoli]QBD80637.1 hypothetical protein EPA93_33555 [Ktedonosporobacter rubrisoli]